MAGHSANYPNRLKAVIKHVGLTEKEVAQETNIPLRTLSDYCAGKVPIPRKRLEEIAQVIGCAPADLVPAVWEKNPARSLSPQSLAIDHEQSLPFIPEVPTLPPIFHALPLSQDIIERGSSYEEFSMDQLRRDLLHLLGTAGAILPFAELAFDWKRTEKLLARSWQPDAHTTPMNAQTLEHFEELTKTCWKLGNGHDLESAEAVLLSYLPKVFISAQQDSHYQHRAARIAAQGYLLRASLAGHKDDLQARQHFSEQALHFARIAEDHNLQVAALQQLAVTYDYRQRPGKALQIYQEAVPYFDTISPLLRAGVSIRMSGAYAQCGQEKDALHFLRVAHDHFPETPEHDPCYLYSNNGLYSLFLWDGLIHLELDQPREAEQAFAKIDGLAPKMEIPERVRIEFLTYQATTYHLLRELEQSCAYLKASVEASLALGSERRYSEAFDAYQQIRRAWPQEPQVKNLAALFVR
jgi:transcriptional regulator with XRE-family HTH domain